MFNVRLAGGHLYGKQLFTWLSLVVSFMASFVLSFFPLDVLDGIWDLIESVSEGFLTYSYVKKKEMAGTVLFPNDSPVNTLTHLCTKDFNFCAYCRLGKSEIVKINVFHFVPKNAKIR